MKKIILACLCAFAFMAAQAQTTNQDFRSLKRSVKKVIIKAEKLYPVDPIMPQPATFWKTSRMTSKGRLDIAKGFCGYDDLRIKTLEGTTISFVRKGPSIAVFENGKQISARTATKNLKELVYGPLLEGIQTFR